MYIVSKCIYELNNGDTRNGWIIENTDSLYPFYANRYLHKVGVNSDQTSRQYAYKLCKYFNYLDAIFNTTYIHATQNQLIHFLDYICYGSNIISDSSEPVNSGNTVQLYTTVISGLYNYLYSIGVSFDLSVNIKEIAPNKYSYHFGQNYYERRKKVVINNAYSKSPKKQKHIKWYTDDQINAILDNLNTYRDKAIFSLTCDGMRIDEAISPRYEDYNSKQCIVTAFRSKGRVDGNTFRDVHISENTKKYIDDYIFNERNYTEEYLLSNGIIPENRLFINIKRNNSCGKELSYRNILQIIKSAAKKAGLDPKTIRTHSGRSTKAMELVRLQSTDPTIISDRQIADSMGWKSINSIEPYKNTRDDLVLKNNYERLTDAKRNRNKNK